MPKNTTQCPRPGIEHELLAPESSALTMRPARLPHPLDRTPLIYDCITTCIEMFMTIPINSAICFLSNASSNNEKTHKRIHQGEIRTATNSGGLLSTICVKVSTTATKASQTT